MPMQKVGRLAMRVEGDNWNAYYALPETMLGAVLLGSIRMTLVQDQARKQMFLDLMRHAVSAILENAVGVAPEWNDPVSAPESERTKS